MIPPFRRLNVRFGGFVLPGKLTRLLFAFGCQFADIVVNLTGKPANDVCGYFERARKIGAVMAAFSIAPIPHGRTAHA
uniref:Uncharacterized protein n=1 Tax=Neisseria meningitidis alpha275 TaxID=295996 RepID=C6SI22_NEIME|nr:hypothetical protein predicted by Glimmer/Critica [Neisseria meningitidis alpha275]